ncbi:MAG: pilus assembly protein [Alphaproteobacteria bacterium]|jgi:Flp pilus assembly protein TadG|nr:pilus assembly protein [Alphaproteobacteria bacterium]
MILFKKFRQFTQETKGASMVEFALILPLLLTVSLGIYEATNYILLNAKLNEISSGVANWVGAQTSTATITDCLIGANLMGTDYNFTTKGKVIVTGLQQVGTSTSQTLVWQQGSPGALSQISSGGQAPFPVLVDKNVIIVEVSYQYQPTFPYLAAIFPSITLSKVAQSVPRGSGAFNPLPAT